jgi:hypothetical protein
MKETYFVYDLQPRAAPFPHIDLVKVASSTDYYEAHEWACRVSETTGRRAQLLGFNSRFIGEYSNGRLVRQPPR